MQTDLLKHGFHLPKLFSMLTVFSFAVTFLIRSADNIKSQNKVKNQIFTNNKMSSTLLFLRLSCSCPLAMPLKRYEQFCLKSLKKTSCKSIPHADSTITLLPQK